MTAIRDNRERYAATHAAHDPRPSRFADEGRTYRAWAERADRWADSERYGADSNVFKPWDKIHDDYRLTSGGVRRVLVLDRTTGATVLAPWLGPEGAGA